MAPWERRIGVLRVYYDVEDIPEPKVYIRAGGIKERNRVRLAGEMKITELTEATETLATYTADVAQEPVILMVAGKPVAALVAIENAALETVSLSTNPAFLALIDVHGTKLREGSPVQRCDVG